jgi:hypothetical protein
MNKKFRAWDKFNGCYWYSDNYKNLAEFFTAMQDLIDGGNELTFEMWIGLNDKNEKEIYENMPIKFTEIVGYGTREHVGKFTFDRGCFWFRAKGRTECNWHFYNNNCFEIIEGEGSNDL